MSHHFACINQSTVILSGGYKNLYYAEGKTERSKLSVLEQ